MAKSWFLTVFVAFCLSCACNKPSQKSEVAADSRSREEKLADCLTAKDRKSVV